MVVRVKCKKRIECDWYFPFVSFVVLTVDHFVGRGGAHLNDRNRIATFFGKTGSLPLIVEKIRCLYINDEV